MSSNDPKEEKLEAKDERPEAAGNWWENSLSRRDVGRMGLGAAIGLGALSLGASISGCCGDDSGSSGSGSGFGSADDVQVEDSLAIQQKSGWDFGADAKKLTFPSSTAKDSKKSDAWKKYVDDKKLLEVTRPTQKDWLGYEGTDLVLATDQKSLAKQLTPMFNKEMETAYGRGKSLASLVTASKDPEKTLLILDLPGHRAVAAAAGLADKVEPVFYFDNWPHPNAVVPAHQTLAALLYYADELKEKRKEREGKKLPVALILDANRLLPYKDGAGQFDNRYIAEPPSATALKRLGIERVMYVTWAGKDKELDDLNETLVEYEEKKIPVNLISMHAFAKAESDPDPEKRTDGYYYGGDHRHHTYFYNHYPMFIWFHTGGYYSSWNRTPTAPPASRARKSSWRARKRSTVFSGYKGGKGAKPKGFGRVATRKTAGGGVSWARRSSTVGRSRSSFGSGGSKSRGSSPGRSGSFGRSRGGGWSG